LPYHFYDAVTLKTSAKRAQAIIVSSKFEYEDALEFGIKKEKIHIIPMGIDVKEFKNKPSFSEELQILFVGRIARVRRIELLLQAVSRLSFPFHLTIVGGEEKTSSVTRTGYLNELKQLTKKLNLENKVTFVGKKLSQELKTFYQSADIFVYPSLYENFAQPLLEAASYGLPLISTSVGIARDIIIEGETGYHISGKPEEIKERIESLKDSKLRWQMGQQIQNEVKNKFDWGNIMEQYISLYCSI
jgi:glycosyltransferase involved in cell wall biosynthesis